MKSCRRAVGRALARGGGKYHPRLAVLILNLENALDLGTYVFRGRRDVRPLVLTRWRKKSSGLPKEFIMDFQLGRGVKDFRRGGGLAGLRGACGVAALWIEGHGITAAGLGL